jgi:hypothetical protein
MPSSSDGPAHEGIDCPAWRLAAPAGRTDGPRVPAAAVLHDHGLASQTLLLLTFRDTIFSLQANFVPALIVTEGGPSPYSTTYLPLFVYREGFEYLRYGYAAAAIVIMFVATLLIVFIQWRIIRRWRHAFAV